MAHRLPLELRGAQQQARGDPGLVLASCENHLERNTIHHGEEFTLSAPRYPFYLLLRASGAVSRVHANRVTEVPVPGSSLPATPMSSA